MRVTREGIELQRGNIRVHVSRETALEGIKEVRRREQELREFHAKSDYDPEGYITRPSVHSVHQKVAPRWTGSGSSTNPTVKTSYLPYKNEYGATVQPGLSTADLLEHYRKRGV